MDIPLALDRLVKLGELPAGLEWGPLAQSDATYAEFAAYWRGTVPVPTEARMRQVYNDWLAEQQSDEAKLDRATVSDRNRVLMAVILRTHSNWPNLQAGLKSKVQSIIDTAADDILNSLNTP